jgi:hypothetical protein
MKKHEYNNRADAARLIAKTHLVGPKHEKMLERAGGIDGVRAKQAAQGPKPKQAKTTIHCMGIALYPLAENAEPTCPMESFLHTMIRYIPHNVDSQVMLVETEVGTRGLRVRALRCDGKGADTDPCKPCLSYVKSQHLINKGVRWASKLDGLLWYELLADGADEAAQTAFEEMIDQRDYVVEMRGSEIGEFTSIKNIAALRTSSQVLKTIRKGRCVRVCVLERGSCDWECGSCVYMCVCAAPVCASIAS